MAGRKKSRKVGQIGTPNKPSRPAKQTEKRVKKTKGKPAGSRNSEPTTSKQNTTGQGVKDSRLGSKKPVELVVQKKQVRTAAQKKHFSPKEELASIEQDSRLSSLLDKIDNGQTVTKEEQQYADQRLARHKVLCGMLGIVDEPEDKPIPEEDSADPFSTFESINIDDFKD